MNRSEAEEVLAQLQRDRPKSTMVGATYLEDLDARTEDVIMWCRRYSNAQAVRACLRPARLSPHPLPTSRWEAVQAVALARSAELGRAPDVTLNGPEGQLLVYFPDRDQADGAAEVASKGYFDIHNAPPSGTWIGYFDEGDRKSNRSSYLLAWVPHVFVPLASQGILTNKQQCIEWLADANVPLRHVVNHLRSRIFIG